MSAPGGRETKEARVGRWQDTMGGTIIPHYIVAGVDMAEFSVHAERGLYCAHCDALIARQSTLANDGTCFCHSGSPGAERLPNATYLGYNIVRRSDPRSESAPGLPVYGRSAREQHGRGARGRKGYEFVSTDARGAVHVGWPFHPETMQGWPRRRRWPSPKQWDYLPEAEERQHWWPRRKAGLPPDRTGWLPNRVPTPCEVICSDCGGRNLIIGSAADRGTGCPDGGTPFQIEGHVRPS